MAFQNTTALYCLKRGSMQRNNKSLIFWTAIATTVVNIALAWIYLYYFWLRP